MQLYYPSAENIHNCGAVALGEAVACSISPWMVNYKNIAHNWSRRAELACRSCGAVNSGAAPPGNRERKVIIL